MIFFLRWVCLGFSKSIFLSQPVPPDLIHCFSEMPSTMLEEMISKKNGFFASSNKKDSVHVSKHGPEICKILEELLTKPFSIFPFVGRENSMSKFFYKIFIR